MLIITLSILIFQLNRLCQGRSELSSYYDYRQDKDWTKWSFIYDQYLNRTAFGPQCKGHSGTVADITTKDIEIAFEKADKQVAKLRKTDQNYLETDPRGLNFSAYLYEANLQAIYDGFATKNLMTEKCLSELEVVIKLTKLHRTRTPKAWDYEYCRFETDSSPKTKCDDKYKYHRIDGKCNNLVNTEWGSAQHCQRRLLPPDYGDGVSQPRQASDGSPLPNARLVSTVLLADGEELDLERTHMHMIWGQFMAHDIIKTPQMFGLAMNCCPPDGQTPVHQECMFLKDIPRDRLAIAFNQSCISFVRSLGCETCSLGPRNQLTMATSVLDLSHIYGNALNQSDSLRSFYKGEMLLMNVDGNHVLPKAHLPEDQDRGDLTKCSPPTERPWLTCFRTGDGIRGNQNPMSISMNIIYIERHNQHCRGLAKVNPCWSDERIFQEARRLLIAEYNVINFNEFIATVLNEETMNFYQLKVKEKGFTEYDENVEPSIIQSFGVCAFRYGHTQITSLIQVLQQIKYLSTGFRLREKYFDASMLWDGEKDALVRGMCEGPTGRVDQYFSPDVHNYLFLPKCNPRIIDLAQINIMRAQDHGVPAYVYYLEYCTGRRVTSWNDLNQIMAPEYVRQMKAIYKDVKDVDLFVGGLAEKPAKGSLVGPTFQCIIAKQFYHLKYGDRFYMEHGQEAGSFTEDQLNNIRQVAWLANVLCKTTNIETIQRNAFLLPSKTNPVVFCKDMPEFDYKLWKEC